MAKPQRWTQRLNVLTGKRIADTRRGLPGKVTQQELSERTKNEVSRSSIANIESGRQGMSLEQLYTLAKALVVEPHDILPSKREVFELDLLAGEKKPKVRAFILEAIRSEKEENA